MSEQKESATPGPEDWDSTDVKEFKKQIWSRQRQERKNRFDAEGAELRGLKSNVSCQL